MKLFQYTRLQSRIHPISHAITAKWSYLFSDRAVLCTETGFTMHFRRELESRNMRSRIYFVKEDMQNNSPELLPEFGHLVAGYDKLSKKKHRSAAEIVAIKKSEKVINDFYKLVVEELAEPVERTGLHVLSGVPDEGLCYYHIHPDKPEQNGEGYTPASRILQLLGDAIDEEDDKDVAFILPLEALTPDCRPGQVYTIEDPEAADAANIWLERVMELPNFNAFNALELQVLRSQIRKGGTAFYAAFDQWIDAAVTGSMDAAQRLSFYKEQVQPAAATWSDAARQTKLLSNMRAAAGGRHMLEVWIGEMPLQRIWDFYAAAQITLAETREQLSTPEALARGKMRVPVVVLAGVNEGTPEDFARVTEGASAEEIMPVSVRKRLII